MLSPFHTTNKRVLILVVLGGLSLLALLYHYRYAVLRRLRTITNQESLNNSDSRRTESDALWGIDISHHQNVNWEVLVERNKPGFIFMKATEGTTHSDSKYKEYRKKAAEHNITSGAYHFFSYTSPGITQAQHFIKQAQLQPGDILPVLDIEYRKNGGIMPSAETIQREVFAFCREILRHFGHKPIIYCEAAFYRAYLSEDYEDYPLWISDMHREPSLSYDFWQYTDRGMVHGIGKIDNNLLREGVNLSEYLIGSFEQKP